MTFEDIAHYYQAGREHDRLTRAVPLEWTRTTELIERYLPLAPAVIADIGGGSGPYAFWLAERGYTVHLRDKMPLHIEQARAAMATHTHLASLAVGDARSVDLPDASVAAVLLLGPLYHLTEQEDRLQALREAYRIVQPGGIIMAAAISRYATVLDGMKRGYFDDPEFAAIAYEGMTTGQHRNPTAQHGYFTTAYLHRLDELLQETQDAGFSDATLFAVEGPMWLTSVAQERWDDPILRERYLAAIRWIEQDMALMATTSHMLVVGKKPAA